MTEVELFGNRGKERYECIMRLCHDVEAYWPTLVEFVSILLNVSTQYHTPKDELPIKAGGYYVLSSCCY